MQTLNPTTANFSVTARSSAILRVVLSPSQSIDDDVEVVIQAVAPSSVVWQNVPDQELQPWPTWDNQPRIRQRQPVGIPADPIRKSTRDGTVVVTDPVSGEFTVRIRESDFAASGKYFWTAYLKDGFSRTAIASGFVEVTPSWSRQEEPSTTYLMVDDRAGGSDSIPGSMTLPTGLNLIQAKGWDSSDGDAIALDRPTILGHLLVLACTEPITVSGWTLAIFEDGGNSCFIYYMANAPVTTEVGEMPADAHAIFMEFALSDAHQTAVAYDDLAASGTFFSVVADDPIPDGYLVVAAIRAPGLDVVELSEGIFEVMQIGDLATYCGVPGEMREFFAVNKVSSLWSAFLIGFSPPPVPVSISEPGTGAMVLDLVKSGQPVTLVQHVVQDLTLGNTIQWAQATQNGNLLVVVVMSPLGCDIPDGWRRAVNEANVGNAALDMFYLGSADPQSSAGPFTGLIAVAMEWQLGTVDPLDKTAKAYGYGSASINSGTTEATVQAEELVLAAMATQTYSMHGFTAGYTVVAQYGPLVVLSRVTASVGQQQCVAVTDVAGFWSGVIGAFKTA